MQISFWHRRIYPSSSPPTAVRIFTIKGCCVPVCSVPDGPSKTLLLRRPAKHRRIIWHTHRRERTTAYVLVRWKETRGFLESTYVLAASHLSGHPAKALYCDFFSQLWALGLEEFWRIRLIVVIVTYMRSSKWARCESHRVHLRFRL